MPQYCPGDIRVRGGIWLDVPRPIPLAQVIRGALLNALAFTDGRQDKAARLLGITARVMTQMMGRHGIPRPQAGPVKKPLGRLDRRYLKRPSTLVRVKPPDARKAKRT